MSSIFLLVAPGGVVGDGARSRADEALGLALVVVLEDVFEDVVEDAAEISAGEDGSSSGASRMGIRSLAEPSRCTTLRAGTARGPSSARISSSRASLSPSPLRPRRISVPPSYRIRENPSLASM